MGLREIKKQRARGAILEAARELFFSTGYDGTTVEAIAAKAEVAVGTVYNYFESKSAIILAITEEDTSEYSGGEYAISDTDSLPDVLRGYVHTFMEVLSRYPKQLLRELMREALGSSGGSLGEGIIRQDITLLEELEELFRRLRASGRLRDEVSTEMASLLVYGTVMTSLIWYAADTERKPEEMIASLDGMLETACLGLGPEGEAV